MPSSKPRRLQYRRRIVVAVFVAVGNYDDIRAESLESAYYHIGIVDDGTVERDDENRVSA